MKEALSSSETSVLTRATRRNIPEDTILHSHCCENLKSNIIMLQKGTSSQKSMSFWSDCRLEIVLQEIWIWGTCLSVPPETCSAPRVRPIRPKIESAESSFQMDASRTFWGLVIRNDAIPCSFCFWFHTFKRTPWPLARKGTIPTERPKPVDEI
jgi:hypothetical protein